jgi:hypothetical protein
VAQAVEIALRNQMSKERFIISGENKRFRDIFRTIAEHLLKVPPQICITPFYARLLPCLSIIQTLFHKKEKIITRESIRNTSNNYAFLNQKSIELLGITYRPVDTTIAESCAQFLESARHHFKPAYLPL